MSDRMLYKYRGLDNFEFFGEIILNNKLYAAQFNTLNDPMEGHYYYSINDESRKSVDRWMKDFFDQKQKHRICSLSSDNNNMLMWSHYANSHKGVCIGVTIETDPSIIHSDSVTYVEELPTLQSNSTPKDVLMKKLKSWNYEEEYRVISSEQFVKVKVKEIILGSRCSPVHKKTIRALVEKFAPDISIRSANSR